MSVFQEIESFSHQMFKDASPQQEKSPEPTYQATHTPDLSHFLVNAANSSSVSPDPFVMDTLAFKTKRSNSWAPNSPSANEKENLRRERNRIAAMKCRKRKRGYVEDLEKKLAFLAQENFRLQSEMGKFTRLS